jgi:LmbE family N-acetylglucosaminyl deacetylase
MTIGSAARSILFVFAHPDDESHWGSGVAIRCHEEGARTVLVTATRGERGTTGDVCPVDELPRVRELELRDAARILKFDDLEVLTYKDKELTNAPPDEIRRTLVRIVRRERPSIVVTFDPNGITLHADHLAISRFVSDALPAAADPRFYPDLGDVHDVTRLLWTPPVLPWDGGEFPPRPGVDFLIDTAAWWHERAAALRAHRTQHVTLEKLYLNQPNCEQMLSFDVLRQAWGPRLANRPAVDVFAGMTSGD